MTQIERKCPSCGGEVVFELEIKEIEAAVEDKTQDRLDMLESRLERLAEVEAENRALKKRLSKRERGFGENGEVEDEDEDEDEDD